MRRSEFMREALLLLSGFFLLTGWSFFDPFHKHVEQGNRSADGEQPEKALEQYGQAARIDPGSPVPDFNRGIVLSGQGDPEAAKNAFVAATASEDPAIAADALYNLGNVLMENQEFGPAIESYLKSLDLDPSDADAQKNLEIAVRRLEEQQQQQEKEDQSQDESKDEEPQENQDQPREEPPEDPNESQSESSQQEQNEEPQPQPEDVPPEERLTREDAERLLNAIESDELKVLQQLQETDEEAKGAVTNDW